MQILVESKLTKTNKSDSVTDEDDEWVSSVLLHQEKVKVEVCRHIFSALYLEYLLNQWADFLKTCLDRSLRAD